MQQSRRHAAADEDLHELLINVAVSQSDLVVKDSDLGLRRSLALPKPNRRKKRVGNAACHKVKDLRRLKNKNF